MSEKVQSYIEGALDIIRVRYPEVFAVCPWCGDQRGKFSFNVDRGVGRCWRASCDEKTGLTKLIAHVERVGFGTAAQRARELRGGPNFRPQEEYRTYDSVGETPFGCVPLDYTTSDPEISSLVRAAQHYIVSKRGFPLGVALDAGILVGTAGYWAGRVVLPAYQDGVLVSAIGRTLEVEVNGYWLSHPAAGPMKYRTPRDEDDYLPREDVLFGIDAVRSARQVVLVEDSFSSLALRALSPPRPQGSAFVALWGTSLTKHQLAKLDAYWPPSPDREVVLLLDADAARSADKIAAQVQTLGVKVKVASIELDPDEDLEAAMRAIAVARSFTFSSQLESLLK